VNSQRALLEHVSAMARELAPGTIAALASDIGTGRESVPPNARIRVLTERLKELWASVPEVGGAELSFALLAAKQAAGDQADLQTMSLVWTGPDTDVPVRRNDEALYEVVASSMQELLIVSFVVYHVPRVRDGIANAVERGVDVTLVFERHGSGVEPKEERFDPVQAMGQLPSSVRILEWPIDRRPVVKHKLGYIHAKCAVADRRVAVVSSANLTLYGLEANMELGVLIEGGPVPARIAAQFEHLEADAILAPVRV
jgi:cardiolipin synthase A/B